MSSMAYNAASGLGGMLKDGHRHWDDAVIRNIDASTEIAKMVSTSFGPFGRHKLLINHLQQMSVTSDCATILKELEVEHPAAKLLALASQKQKEECGDSTNLVVMFAGELLHQTLNLMKMGLHVSEVIAGYHVAATTLWEELPHCVTTTISITSKEELIQIVEPVLGSKIYGSESALAPLVVEACLCVKSPKGKISPDAVRTIKVLGGTTSDCKTISGYVSQRPVESLEANATNCKIVVFACGLEASSTEAKGTVLMKNAHDLKNYNVTEERKMEEIVQSIAETGVKVIVTGGSVSEMALHFVNRYKLILMKIGSKWELRRLCQAVGATALVRLGPPTPDEMGFADSVSPLHLGSKTLSVFQNSSGKLATIVLRASTHSRLQDIERAVDNAVHALSQASKSGGQCVPGAGATEFLLSQKIMKRAQISPGLDQYAIRAFGQALQIVPRTLAETAGWSGPNTLADMVAYEGDYVGIDLKNSRVGETHVLDLLAAKKSALQLALDAAMTVLRIDQIIMSKQSGGPKPQ
jgi:T-complex protein 1 subunit theta